MYWKEFWNREEHRSEYLSVVVCKNGTDGTHRLQNVGAIEIASERKEPCMAHARTSTLRAGWSHIPGEVETAQNHQSRSTGSPK